MYLFDIYENVFCYYYIIMSKLSHEEEKLVNELKNPDLSNDDFEKILAKLGDYGNENNLSRSNTPVNAAIAAKAEAAENAAAKAEAAANVAEQNAKQLAIAIGLKNNNFGFIGGSRKSVHKSRKSKRRISRKLVKSNKIVRKSRKSVKSNKQRKLRKSVKAQKSVRKSRKLRKSKVSRRRS